jgi:hypothetical protein
LNSAVCPFYAGGDGGKLHRSDHGAAAVEVVGKLSALCLGCGVEQWRSLADVVEGAPVELQELSPGHGCGEPVIDGYVENVWVGGGGGWTGGGRVRRLRRNVAEYAHETVDAEGLVEEGGEVAGLCDGGFAAAHANETRWVWECGDGGGEFRTVHAGHTEVDQYGIEGRRNSETLESEFAGVGGVDGMAQDMEERRKQVGQDGVVIDDEDP